MTTYQLIGPIFLLTALATGCHQDSARKVVLKEGVFTVCDTAKTMTLRTLPEGKYGLTAAVVDSAHLGSLLHTVLPPTPGPRVLMVDFAPERAREVQWVVPLVEAEGYAAYKADARCTFRLGVPSARTPISPV